MISKGDGNLSQSLKDKYSAVGWSGHGREEQLRSQKQPIEEFKKLKGASMFKT